MTKMFAIMSHFDICISRLYWLDGSLIQSSSRNGSDIKSHVVAIGATSAFVFKVMKIVLKRKHFSFFLFQMSSNISLA